MGLAGPAWRTRPASSRHLCPAAKCPPRGTRAAAPTHLAGTRAQGRRHHHQAGVSDGGSRAASTSMLIHRRAGRSSFCAYQRVAAPAKNAPASTLIAAPQGGWGWRAGPRAQWRRKPGPPRARSTAPKGRGRGAPPPPCRLAQRKLSSTSADTHHRPDPQSAGCAGWGEVTHLAPARPGDDNKNEQATSQQQKRNMKPVGVAGVETILCP